MLKLNVVILFSEKPQKLVEFYKKVFEREPDWSGGDFYGFKSGESYLTIGPHSEVHGDNKTPERLIFQFEIEDVHKEFERLKALGARVVMKPYHPGEDSDMSLATFADPDNNYFQIGSPMKNNNLTN